MRNHYGYWIVWIRLPFMYISVLVSFCWRVFFRRLFRIFDLFLLFFNDFDLFPYRFHDIYLKSPRNSMTSAKRSNVQSKPLSYNNITGELAPIFLQSSKWSRKNGGFWSLLMPSPWQLVHCSHANYHRPGSFLEPTTIFNPPGFLYKNISFFQAFVSTKLI